MLGGTLCLAFHQPLTRTSSGGKAYRGKLHRLEQYFWLYWYPDNKLLLPTCFPCYFPLLSHSFSFIYHTNEFKKSGIAIKFLPQKYVIKNKWKLLKNYNDLCSLTAFKDNCEKLGTFTVPVSIQRGLMFVCLWDPFHALGCSHTLIS